VSRRSALLPAAGTVLAHALVAVVGALILLRPAPRWFVVYEISATPLPLPSQLAWGLSSWLRRLLPLAVLAAPFVFALDGVLAHRLFRRSPRHAGLPWFWGVLALELLALSLWLVAALLLPRRDL
jgi:type II secretory pathway component PulF